MFRATNFITFQLNMHIPATTQTPPFRGPSYDHAMHDTKYMHSKDTLVHAYPSRTCIYKNEICLETPKLNGGSTNAIVESKTTLVRVCKVTLTVEPLPVGT
jgi:hypothetical protein